MVFILVDGGGGGACVVWDTLGLSVMANNSFSET
jgi:hypothetical protein